MTLHPSISAQGISVTYEQWDVRVLALKDASFSFEGPGWVLITGPNGSGKSTLLNVIAGTLRPDKGIVTIGGKAIIALGPTQRSKLISIARQRAEDGLVAGMTVVEHARLCGFRWTDFVAAINRLELGEPFVFFEGVKSQAIESLSGGQRRILSLLLQLLRPTPVILLDEPLANLDPEKSTAFVSLLRRMRTAKTIIQVTHEPKLVRAYADIELKLVNGYIDTIDLQSKEP